MKIEALTDYHGSVPGPDPWDEDWGICLPLNHVICYDLNGTPHTVGEFIWPWSAYTAHRSRLLLHFFYWKQSVKRVTVIEKDITPERIARIRELQFLMTRQIYCGNEISPKSLYAKLCSLHCVARFAEEQSCTVLDVLTQSSLLDACSASLSNQALEPWMRWLSLFRSLNPETQLGFTLAKPKYWNGIRRRHKVYRDNSRQFAPLPTRIYAQLINNLSSELDDIELHMPRLLAALHEAVATHVHAYAHFTSTKIKHELSIAPGIIEKHGLVDYLERHSFNTKRLVSLAGAVGEIFMVCKLQINVFSGMRTEEAKTLPFHCMAREKGLHGRNHFLIVGSTTKFNKGRCLRTKWVSTEFDGFRAIRLAQKFASVIYDSVGIKPSKVDNLKDNCPLFPTTDLLPWMKRHHSLRDGRISTFTRKNSLKRDPLMARLCPLITEEDIAELEEIDPFRSWNEEPDFSVGQRWPLTTHQLRRSLAVYANASGLVRLSSLRRQLQHMTREMALYYGRGSTFCKNFIADDPGGYKKHVAVDWQDGAEEAEMLAFVRDVLNSTEPMFGGAGNFYERQRERGEVMSREEVVKQIKSGLLAYREGPLGGCTRPGVCETRKGLNLIDTVCATDGCKHLIGRHSKIVQTIRFKRAAMAHITRGSITEMMEREDLEALERVEREWRSQENPLAHSTGDGNV